MDFHLLNEFAKERIHEFQNSDPPITPFYSPFNSHWKPRIAKYFYLLASKLEPQNYPPAKARGKIIKRQTI